MFICLYVYLSITIGNHDNSDAKKNIDATVGLLICKADVLDTTTKIKKKPPRQNIMGEVLATSSIALLFYIVVIHSKLCNRFTCPTG